MAKIRVHQLAKELHLDSKAVIEEAQKHGISVKNHMSSLSPADEMMLRAFLETLRPKSPPKVEPEALPVGLPAGVRRAPPLGGPIEPKEPEPALRAAAEGRPALARPEELVSGQPRRPAAETPRVRQVVAGVPGAARSQAETLTEGTEEPAAAASQEAPAKAPKSIQAVRTATVRPTDARVVTREPAVLRRQAQILGRKDLPAQKSPAPRTGGLGRQGRGSLIATRTESGRRTFVNTGRGRGPAVRRTTPGGRRGGRRRRRKAPLFTEQIQQDLASTAPDTLSVQLPLTVKGLSERLGVKANILIQQLFKNHGKMVKINDPLDRETIELLGVEFDCEIAVSEREDVETQVLQDLDDQVSNKQSLQPRPPIVTFLGHVDHGKTSLLDAMRQTDVANREQGGITQHIGASRIELEDGRSVTFVDTPGHKAFTEMRARGAQVTDVVVLVVAADDGVMPQTKEAIAHARAANVPVVVALNKMDKPDANPMKVRQELAAEGLQDEQWGGETMIKEVSATTGAGIPELLEALLLEAELLELKTDPSRPARATVIEAQQTRGEGNTARLVVMDGTLHKGDTFICGTAFGRIRAIKGPHGELIQRAGASVPVEITGLNQIPNAGDKLYVLEDVSKAKEIADQRMLLIRKREIAKASHVSLENLFERSKGQTLKIILKVDVTGSREVLQQEIMNLTHPEIRPEIILAGVGGITESDVLLAQASKAVILGFHVTADLPARRAAEEKKVEIRIYQVLYKLTEELKAALEGRLAPEEKEVITGELEVRKTWRVSRLGVIAGAYVQNGTIKRDSLVRVSRGGIVIFEAGSLDSLKRFKDDVKEVKEGFECGLLIKGFDQIQEGDIVTAFEIEKIRRTLN